MIYLLKTLHIEKKKKQNKGTTKVKGKPKTKFTARQIVERKVDEQRPTKKTEEDQLRKSEESQKSVVT